MVQLTKYRYAASVILRLMYGKTTPTSVDDPEVIRGQQSSKNLLNALRPGAFLVDRFPLLKYIPGYVKQLKECHNFELRLYRDQMKRVQSEMVGHSAEPVDDLRSHNRKWVQRVIRLCGCFWNIPMNINSRVTKWLISLETFLALGQIRYVSSG